MGNMDGNLLSETTSVTSGDDSAVPTGLPAEEPACPGTEVPGYSQASLTGRSWGSAMSRP